MSSPKRIDRLPGVKGPAGFEMPPEVRRAVDYALNRKAVDVTVLDLHDLSGATDFFVIATGHSDIHVRAIAEHVINSAKGDGNRAERIEGLDAGRWVLLDYIDYVVHIFHPAVRDFYRLEALWGDARSVRIQGSAVQ